jgi:hypothetical protein
VDVDRVPPTICLTLPACRSMQGRNLVMVGEQFVSAFYAIRQCLLLQFVRTFYCDWEVCAW